MEKYYITRYYLSLAVFIHLNYKIRKYCQPSFGYSWHKHTNTHREQSKKKNPKLQACFIFQLVKYHGSLSLAAHGDATLLARPFSAPCATAGEGRVSAAGTQNFTTSHGRWIPTIDSNSPHLLGKAASEFQVWDCSLFSVISAAQIYLWETRRGDSKPQQQLVYKGSTINMVQVRNSLKFLHE